MSFCEKKTAKIWTKKLCHLNSNWDEHVRTYAKLDCYKVFNNTASNCSAAYLIEYFIIIYRKFGQIILERPLANASRKLVIRNIQL